MTLRQGAQDAADADSPAAFVQALAALAPQFQALLDMISATADDLENANFAEEAKAKLRKAFSSSAACQQLRADG